MCFPFFPQLVFSIYTGDSGQTDRAVVAYQCLSCSIRAVAYREKSWRTWCSGSMTVTSCWQWRLESPVWPNMKQLGVTIHSCVLVILTVRQRALAECFSLFQTLKNSCCSVSSLQMLSKMKKSAGLYSDCIKWQTQREKCKAASVSFLHFWGIWTRGTRTPDVLHKWISGAVTR